MKSILLEMKKMIDEKQTNKLTMLGEVEKEGNPFKVLISTILSSRTKDDTTYKAVSYTHLTLPTILRV